MEGLKYVLRIFTNRVLMCAVASWLMAQILKLFTTPDYRKNFSVKKLLLGTGGMPSSHTAVVVSACFSCGILYGFDHPLFAVTGVLAVVVMQDAAGVRRQAGKQAEMLNKMSQELSTKRKNFSEYTLQEMMGHTPLQVLFGAILGVLMAALCQCWLFDLIPAMNPFPMMNA